MPRRFVLCLLLAGASSTAFAQDVLPPVDRFHVGAGRKYPAGAKLTMEQHKAEWLIGLGVAEASAEPTAEAVSAAAQPKTAKAKE